MRSSLLVLAAAIVLGALGAACGSAPKPDRAREQRDTAQKLSPAELAVPPSSPQGAPHGATATLHARVWVDQDVRKRPDWRARFDESLARINAYLTAAFGVRIDPEVKDWARKAPAADLEPILRELMGSDPARDVDCVIGLVAPLGSASNAHHHQGLAPVPARHFVIRALDPALDRQEIDRTFDALQPREREAFAEARSRHKDVVFFVHEWAHSFGALHEDAADSIMNVGWDPHARTFSEPGAKLVRLGLEIRRAERGGDARKDAELWGEVTATLEKAGATFPAAELEPYLAAAKKMAGGANPTAGMGEGDRAELEAAKKAADAGDRTSALAKIDALLARHPREAGLRKAALSFYESLGALSKADGLAETPGDKALILSRRRLYGLPPDAVRYGIAPEAEPEYVAVFEAAHQALSARNLKALADRTATGLKRFPRAPGLLALACASDFLGKRLERAQKNCKAALAGWDETVLAHFFAGQIASGAARKKHLDRVLELDPSQEKAVKEILRRGD